MSYHITNQLDILITLDPAIPSEVLLEGMMMWVICPFQKEVLGSKGNHDSTRINNVV